MLRFSFQVDFDRPKSKNTLPEFCPAEIDNLLLLLNGDEVGEPARSAFLDIARGLVGSFDGSDHLLEIYLVRFEKMSHEQRVGVLGNIKA